MPDRLSGEEQAIYFSKVRKFFESYACSRVMGRGKKMSDEYIRKADAVDAVEFGITLASAINIETGERTELFQRENDELREAVKRIKDIEPADVVPVVHAHWIPQKENHEFKEAWMKCSACGYPVSRWTGNTNFCPNCGAKMDGGEA